MIYRRGVCGFVDLFVSRGLTGRAISVPTFFSVFIWSTKEAAA
jgi:hypothetical protein